MWDVHRAVAVRSVWQFRVRQFSFELPNSTFLNFQNPQNAHFSRLPETKSVKNVVLYRGNCAKSETIRSHPSPNSVVSSYVILPPGGLTLIPALSTDTD
jgi:hypothetical protein